MKILGRISRIQAGLAAMLLCFRTFFDLTVISLAVPEVALELSIVEGSFVHEFDAFFGVKTAVEFDFADAVGVVWEEIDLMDRTYLLFNLVPEFPFQFLEKLLPRHLNPLKILFIELRSNVLQLLQRIEPLEYNNFEAYFVHFFLIPRHLTLVFCLNSEFFNLV